MDLRSINKLCKTTWKGPRTDRFGEGTRLAADGCLRHRAIALAGARQCFARRSDEDAIVSD